MDSQGKQIPTQEKTTTGEWVLCSPHFKDEALIAPKDLNNISITSQYMESSVKQIQKMYFEAEHPRMYHAKGRKTKPPGGKPKETKNK